MEGQDFVVWCRENGTSITTHHFNGIDWKAVEMQDGWIALFTYWNGWYQPKIQARDMGHAISYMKMHECVPVPIKQI